MEWKLNDFTINTDKEKLSLDVIHSFLDQSYWAKGRSRETIAKSIENSVCFGVFHGDKQVGFARLVTDHATFYFLCDVFIIESYQGKGLGKWLMDCITTYQPYCDMLGVLATRDAHGLYEQYGFEYPENPKKFMVSPRKRS